MSGSLTDYLALAALLMASAPGMPYASAEAVALSVVMNDAIPQRWATVNSPEGLNMRAYPATTRDGLPVPVAWKLPQGQRVQIWMIREDGWNAVTTRNGKQMIGGWVAAEFLNEVTP